MPPKDKYTDPKLRDEVKEEIKQSDKGGAPGQWSARKAQFMASEYKKRGGDYNTDKSEKDESQENLSKWGDEEWQTKEGSGNAKKEDGTEKRYLPKKAWEKMTDEEKEATDKKKQEESKEGKQFVANTDKAKNSRKQASKDHEKKSGKKEDDGENEEEDDNDEDDGQDEDGDADEGNGEEEHQGDKGGEQDGEEEDGKEEEEDDDDDDDDDDDNDAKAGDKRKKSKQANGSSKKQKDNSGNGKSNGTVGSKHMDAKEPGQRGSHDRLPKKGQKAQWKAMPGYVDGEVVEVLTEGKDVDGKSVKASKDDPKIVLKSSSSGKICVHKPDACFYD